MVIVETKINEWLHDIFNTGNDIFADGLYEVIAEGEIKLD